jgi:CubicO group peptidase (beta-lactamase class C family)
MGRIASTLVFLLALAGCAGTATTVAPESAGFSSVRLAAIAAAVQEGVDKHEIPGAVVLLARRGRIGYLRSFGSRDPASGAPMTDDAIFRIASMTKPVTTAAAMILVDEGRLDIDAPVSRYLPAFKDLMVGVETKDASGNASLALEPALREMTVRDLMRHTSGLTYGFIGKSLVKDRYNAANLTDPGQSNADLAAKLARLPLQSQPGTVWQYSMSADVLGRVVEVVSGMELDAFFARRIFAPLRMSDTGFWVGDPAKRARIVGAPVEPSTGKPIALPDVTVPSWQSGGGGLVSTARDYARFCQMLLNGGELDGVRILSRRAVDAMTRDQLPAGIPTLSSRIPAMDVRQEVGNGFGLGVMVRTAEGLDAVRGSVGAYTWSGGLGTYFWVDPRQELVGIILFQTPALVRSAAYWVRLRNLAYEALANP